MSEIAELVPDVVLAKMLDNNIEVQVTENTYQPVRCYADGLQPNKGVGDEFVTVMWNGSAQSRTQPLGCFMGNLALTIFCKLQKNNTVKTQRIRQIIGQCQQLVNGKCHDGYVFIIIPSEMITPTKADSSTGYSHTTINVQWRTIN